jgi:hypothetical protein
MEAGKDLEKLVQKCNVIIKDAVDSGYPVPVGTYIITKPEMKLVPVRILVDFKSGNIRMELWLKKLPGLTNWRQ